MSNDTQEKFYRSLPFLSLLLGLILAALQILSN